MSKQLKTIILWGIAFTLLISACGAQETTPAVDADAIATSAVQTVEARYTEETATREALMPTATIEMPEPTATFAPSPTAVVSAGGSQTACYFAQFMADISIPDGMIMLPGTKFTKTWQIKNVGSCAWDTSHRLYLQSGDGLSTITTFPLPRTVNPGDVINLSVEMTAPEAEGIYTGYWRIATPYGGSFGVGSTDTSLIAKITVAKRPEDAVAVTDVFYTLRREPATGCPANGTKYIVTATVVTNGPTEVRYLWYQHPYDGGIREGGRLTFKEAGRQTISWTWNLRADAVQDPNFERKVSLFIVEPNNAEFRNGMIPFYHSCP